ncbi:hypothetical protein FHP25_24455 [Vineibacter terrae]|uniref:Uncharacterized protein n=1 Tax=Vineibacter terrae TaxID=2586908 RepID=A0A5C8PH87_9HYPH|nr:hypothetical protein [Vineibacter terrae]TXL72705.1 hypothetical protein FHP25_24455 [Vineibacter terrae]
MKVLDILYQEVLRARAKRKSAEEVTDQHVFPFLKAAGELLGKLHTLANKDFQPIQGITPNEKCLSNADFGSLVYLFGMFWSRVETLRQGASFGTIPGALGMTAQDVSESSESGYRALRRFARLRLVQRLHASPPTPR